MYGRVKDSVTGERRRRKNIELDTFYSNSDILNVIRRETTMMVWACSEKPKSAATLTSFLDLYNPTAVRSVFQLYKLITSRRCHGSAKPHCQWPKDTTSREDVMPPNPFSVETYHESPASSKPVVEPAAIGRRCLILL